jgi:hypothetical protein
VKYFGLMAPRPIHWLLSEELEVKKAVEAFAADAGTSVVDVAGPPSAEEIIAQRVNPRKAIELPTVRLHLNKVKHHLTGEAGIEVKCSDGDMDLIVQWARQAEMRKALAANVMPAH